MKQTESAQNKRTANEEESFKLGLWSGLFFYRTRPFSTTNVGDTVANIGRGKDGSDRRTGH